MTPHRHTQYEYDALGALTKIGSMSILPDGFGHEAGRQVGEFVLQCQYDELGHVRRQVAEPQSAFDEMQSDPVRALDKLTRHLYSYDAAGKFERVDAYTDSVTYQHDVREQRPIGSATGQARIRWDFGTSARNPNGANLISFGGF